MIFLLLYSGFLVLLSLYQGTRIWQRRSLARWKKHLALNAHLTTLDTIGAGINGFALSQQARVASDAMEYVYGEIDILAFIALLSLTRPTPETVFYDLGSGAGRTVLACAMVFRVKKSCGIELFPSLDEAGKQQQQRLTTLAGYQDLAKNIVFRCGSFLSVDFGDASLIYIAATGLFGETWEQLNHRLENLQASTIVITTSKPLRSKAFHLMQKTRVQMNFGVVDAYIQRKF